MSGFDTSGGKVMKLKSVQPVKVFAGSEGSVVKQEIGHGLLYEFAKEEKSSDKGTAGGKVGYSSAYAQNYDSIFGKNSSAN